MATQHDSTLEAGKQILAATSISGFLLTWWPFIFAIPGVIYYCVLLAEKFSGKPASSWFRKNAQS